MRKRKRKKNLKKRSLNQTKCIQFVVFIYHIMCAYIQRTSCKKSTQLLFVCGYYLICQVGLSNELADVFILLFKLHYPGRFIIMTLLLMPLSFTVHCIFRIFKGRRNSMRSHAPKKYFEIVPEFFLLIIFSFIQ